jgi:hypothetical protein
MARMMEPSAAYASPSKYRSPLLKVPGSEKLWKKESEVVVAARLVITDNMQIDRQSSAWEIGRAIYTLIS